MRAAVYNTVVNLSGERRRIDAWWLLKDITFQRVPIVSRIGQSVPCISGAIHPAAAARSRECLGSGRG